MGLFSRSKTITDLNIINLLQPDVAMRMAKKSSMFYSDSMEQYNNLYWGWKKEFRTRYSPDYLKRSGFAPSTKAKYKKVKKKAAEAYVRDKYDETIIRVLHVSISYANAEEVARYMLDVEGYDWNDEKNILKLHGKTYTKFYAKFAKKKTSDSEYEENASEDTREDQETVVAVFSGNGNGEKKVRFHNEFAGKTVMIVKYLNSDREKPQHWFIVDTKKVPNRMIESGALEMTAIIPIKVDNKFPKEELKMKRLLNKYGINGGKMIDELSKEEAKEIDNAYIWTGLPFRSPYVPWDEKADDCDIAQQIPQYFHHRWRKKNNYHAMALFKSFDFMAKHYLEPIYRKNKCEDPKHEDDEECKDKEKPGDGAFDYFSTNNNGSVSFSVSDLKLSYSFDLDKKYYKGNAYSHYKYKCRLGDVIIPDKNFISIQSSPDPWSHYDDCNEMGRNGISKIFCSRITPSGPPFEMKVGEYYAELQPHLLYGDNNGPDKTEENKHPERSAGSIGSKLYIYHQINEDTYVIMKIYNYQMKMDISGHSFTSYLDSLPEEGRLIIPLSVYNDLRFSAFYVVQEFSFSLICYSEKTVKLKWYQTFFFKIIMAFLFAFLMAPAGASIGSILMNTVISMAVGYGINMILKSIDNPFLRMILGALIGGLVNFAMSGFDFSSFSLENFLPSAQDLLGAVNQYMQQQAAEEAAKARAAKMRADWLERDTKYFAQLHSMPKVNPVLRVENQTGDTYDTLSPDAFYERMYGNPMWNYEALYDIRGAIDMRITVKNG